jgi:nucleoside-diphosphate kinase
MCSGPSDIYILAAHNAIIKWRQLMGPTKTYQAQYSAPHTIRGMFGLSDTRNATHGSGNEYQNYSFG